jgi:queuine/archaeosine tRNA-ribosyltransferase
VTQVKHDLPDHKPLFVCGVGGPNDIVANLKLGFDVLESRCGAETRRHEAASCYPAAVLMWKCMCSLCFEQ